MFLFHNIKNQISLTELVDISQGLPFPNKNKNISEDVVNYRYQTLYVSAMPSSSIEQLNREELSEFYSDKKIKENRLLQLEDYLVSIRGKIKGYALINNQNLFNLSDDCNGIIATNHFLVLRPRLTARVAFGNLLYYILDMLMPRINEYAIEKQKNKKNGKENALPFITIADLKEISFIIDQTSDLVDLKKQFEYKYDEYRTAHRNFKIKQTEINAFKNEIINIIQPSLHQKSL
jgi:hypothetical protein